MPLRSLALGSNPRTLSSDTPVREVLRVMFDQRINHVALVDEAGKFVGLAGVGVALERVIPSSARTYHGLNDLTFVGDALRMLLDHYRDILDLPATSLLDPLTAPLRVNTPLMEAALLLTRAHGPLPVVDEQGTLLGVLSQRGLLQFLAGQPEEP